jgi:DNA polymerase I-like protein with 3'-5' exonuclease and polymerase domains
MMQAPQCIVVDYETRPIQRRPHYPPEPVGVSIKWPGEPARYYAALHPTQNNCTLQEMIAALRRAWESPLPKLFHHAKFDLAVSYEILGLPRLPWDQVHDTMFLAYLCDPHARKLGLKPLAADLLNWPAEERDALADWIWEHRETLVAAYGGKVTKNNMGEWIWATPGDICGTYANGDTERTEALFAHLWPIVHGEDMGRAYDRERQVLPIFMENEERGMRVNLPQLEEDVAGYSGTLDYVEQWLRRQLRASGLNFDADQDVASVLIQSGVVPEANFARTKPSKTHPNGQLSVSKEYLLPELFTGPGGAQIASALGYRNRLKTCLEMFMRPWLEQAVQMGGYITTNWNQVRDSEGGTRTGRPSTNNHNFLNISKDFSGRDDQYVHPEFLGIAPLPLCRIYILPDEGDEFLHRDFDGQEMRIFAHFEQGDLWRKYCEDPKLDPHAFVGAKLMQVAGREIERTKVKTLNFQGLYGGGVPALQRKMRCSLAEARELKAFHDRALPGRKIFNEEITRLVRTGAPICTWGGRLYFPEPPGFSKKHNRHMSYEYKLINYLIQGSAADVTKQALIDWHSARDRHARFLVTVYDEINISAPRGAVADKQMDLLREVMELPRLTVPMLSSGKRGPNWGELKKCA